MTATHAVATRGAARAAEGRLHGPCPEPAWAEAVCLGCGSALRSATSDGRWLLCPGCGRRFPLVGAKIPVLVREPAHYLACLFLQHDRYLRRQAQRISSLRAAAERRPESGAALAQLADALDWNRALVEAAAAEVESYVTPADLTQALDSPSFIGYSTTLEYLERDWCWLAAGEAEVAATVQALVASIGEHAPGARSALVVGAGTGRIAIELARRLTRVHALDAALTMAQHYHRVLEGGIAFYSVTTPSMRRRADMVARREASPAPPGASRDGGPDLAGYLVGDLAALPFPVGSVDAVVSVYCTDVMPLEGYIDEIVRVLTPRGLFVHFGPLEYHFDDLGRHLSAEEVRAAFEAKGFETLRDDYVELSHLRAVGSMSPRLFDNWVFCAARAHGPG